jgi:hypothetical protein
MHTVAVPPRRPHPHGPPLPRPPPPLHAPPAHPPPRRLRPGRHRYPRPPQVCHALRQTVYGDRLTGSNPPNTCGGSSVNKCTRTPPHTLHPSPRMCALPPSSGRSGAGSGTRACCCGVRASARCGGARGPASPRARARCNPGGPASPRARARCSPRGPCLSPRGPCRSPRGPCRSPRGPCRSPRGCSGA